MLNVQGCAGIELNSTSPTACSVDQQAAQIDLVCRRGVDCDGDATRRRDARKAVALDADCFGDDERAVAGRIKRIDLAERRHRIVGLLEGPTWLGDCACVVIGTCAGNEDTRWLRLCWRIE